MRLVTSILLCLVLAACASPAALRGDELTGVEFDRLADNEVVGFGDKEYRAQEVREQIQAMDQELATWERASDAKARATLAELQAERAREDTARIGALSATADEEIARLLRVHRAPPGPLRVDTGPESVSPGQRIVLAGADFGSDPGTLRLVFSSGSHRFLPITIRHWQPGWVAGDLPMFPLAKAAGEPDQRAVLELATRHGRLLRWPVAFIALRDVAIVSVGSATQCPRPGYHDTCRIGGASTLTGNHAVLFRTKPAAGEDHARIELAHGWMTERLDYVVRRWGYTTGGGAVDKVEGCATGCAETELVVPWHVPADYYGGVRYVVQLYASGPRGVDYH